MKIKHYIILFLTLLSLKGFATHIVGGEIFYDCLGGNNYRITLKLYRDCAPGNALYDNPGTIFIFNSAGTFIDSLCIPFPGSVQLPVTLNNPCLTPPTNICVEQAIYIAVVNLPPIAGGYNLMYQRCCRNGTILNIVTPGGVGSTYMAHIPDASLAACNSSPRYNLFPPIFLCAGVPLNFNHAATDPNGDSLYYQLCDPFTGLNATCPILGPQAANPCPQLGSPPPYSFVPWISPYSGTYPMSASPALAINPTTGLMTGTPNMIGQFVVAVCVSEYRNGVLLDVNKRDFQFNVVNCNLPFASLPLQSPFCFGSNSNFTQNSVGATTYHWDFGVGGTNLDTSNVFAPSYLYSSLGTYTVTLIINPGTVCSDTTSISVTVNPLPAMTSPNSATICSGGTVSIPLTSSLTSTFLWVAANNPNTTGESTSAQSGNTLSNTIINNSASVQTVTYTVTPTSNPQGCAGTPQTVTVTVNPKPTMTSPASATICTGGTVTIPLTSNNVSTYTWIASDNANTTGESTTLQNGSPLSNTITNTSTSLQTVTYTVTPTSSPQGCTGNPQTVNVSVVPTPTITNTTTATICSGSTVSIPLTSNVTSTFSWVAADNPGTTGESITTQAGSPLSNLITNNTAVVQTVTYTVTPTSNPQGCVGTPQTVIVTVNPSPTMTSPNTATICSGGTVTIPLTSNNFSIFSWIAANNPNTTGESTSLQTGSPLSNTITNNTASVQTVTYAVTPVSSPEGCVGTPQTISVTVNPLPTMTSPVSATICNGGTVNIPLTSNNLSTFTWIAADNPSTTGESLTAQTGSPLNNTLTNNVTTVQTVSYTVTPTSSPEGCAGTPQTITVTVIPTPIMTSPSSAAICTGGTVNIPLTSNVSSTYTWIAADNLNTTGESTTTQTGSPLNNTITNNTAFAETISYSVTPTSNPDGCAGTPQTLTVTVNPSPTMTSTGTATICSGGRLSIALTSNNASTFSWAAVSNPNINGESTTAQTGNPINDSIFNNTTLPQTLLYSVTPTSTPQGCVGTPQTITVTANPAANMTSPSSATICTGGTVNIPLTSNFPSPYTWIAADNVNTTGESTTLQVGSPLINTITNNSTSIQPVIYTVTPIYVSGICPGIPQTLTVTVIPTPIITNPVTATVCSGLTVNIPLTSNVNSTYSWIATDNLNTTGESLTSQTANPLINTLTNTGASVEIVSYTVTPTSSPDGCAGTPQILSVSVNPAPIVTSPDSTTICSGGTLSIPLTSNNASTFSWIAANNPNTTGESITIQSGSPLTDVIINNTALVQTVSYTVTPTSTPQGCIGIPQTLNVKLNSGPSMTSPIIATICNGANVNIPLTSNIASTFSWVATANVNTTGESITSQTGDTINDILINTSASVQSVIYTVTPTSTTGVCTGASQTVTVTIIPIPTITSPVADSICSGNMISVPLTSNVTSTYTWIAADNTHTTGESTTIQTGSPLSNTITNDTTIIQTVSYTVTPTSSPDGCSGTPQIVTITVFGKFTADFDFVKVPCTNQVTFYDSSALAPVSWIWNFDDGNSSILQNPPHTYSSIGTYNVQLIASTINNCKDTVIVQVNLAAIIPVTISPDKLICKGDHTQLIATGGVSYHWIPATGLNNASIANPIASPDTTTTYTVSIVTVDMFGDTCLQNLSTTITVIDPSLYSIFATADNDTIMLGHSTIIHAITTSTLGVIWLPSAGLSNSHALNPTATPQSTTTYTVSIMDTAGCPKIATITVYVVSNKCNADDIFVPNTFTPNGDGVNDILYVRGNEISKLYFAVYDRWGEMVFETSDITKGWNGMYKGTNVDPAVFSWYFKAKCYNGEEMKKQGNVTLLR